MDSADLLNRFTYHPVVNLEQGMLYSEVRGHALSFAQWLDNVAPDSRELSLAITHLEEAVFWANAAIARHGDNL
jgi:hypothetical protein